MMLDRPLNCLRHQRMNRRVFAGERQRSTSLGSPNGMQWPGLATSSMSAPALIAGLDSNCVVDVREAVSDVRFELALQTEDLQQMHDLIGSLIRQAVGHGLEFVVAPLFHPRFRRDCIGISGARDGPTTRSFSTELAPNSMPRITSITMSWRVAGPDTVLDSSAWSSSVVGKLSHWIDLDSPVESIRSDSEAVRKRFRRVAREGDGDAICWGTRQAFKQEVAWASHLGVPAVLVSLPQRATCANLAHHINSVVQQSSYVHFWVRVCTTWPEAVDFAKREEPASDDGDVAVERPAAASSTLHFESAADELAALAKSGVGALQRASSLAESLEAVDDDAVAVAPAAAASSAEVGPRHRRPQSDPWEAWNMLRTLCGFQCVNSQ